MMNKVYTEKNVVALMSKESRKYKIKKKTMSTIISILRALLLIGLCFMILQPLFNKISVSFMSRTDLYDSTVINIPRDPTLENYKVVSNLMNYSKALVTTLLVSTLVAILQVASSTVVGYGFARFKFPFKKLLFGFVLLTIVIPPQTIDRKSVV